MKYNNIIFGRKLLNPKIGEIWINLDKFGEIWRNLQKFGINLEKFKEILKFLNKIYKF